MRLAYACMNTKVYTHSCIYMYQIYIDQLKADVHMYLHAYVQYSWYTVVFVFVLMAVFVLMPVLTQKNTF